MARTQPAQGSVEPLSEGILMAVPTHFRFTFRGIFTNTPEQWSFGCHFTRTNTGAPDAGIGDIDQSAVTAAAVTLMQGGASSMSSAAKMVDWRAYVIGTDGKMEGNPLFVDVSGESAAGGAAVRYPPQIALVATLVGPDRGPGRFGRMYLPGPAEGIAADHRLSTGAAAGYADQVTQFLKSVSDAIDMQVAEVSSSGVNVSAGGGAGGTLQVIDHVEVGRVLDTLRTRRNALLEDRQVDGHIDW